MDEHIVCLRKAIHFLRLPMVIFQNTFIVWLIGKMFAVTTTETLRVYLLVSLCGGGVDFFKPGKGAYAIIIQGVALHANCLS